MRRQHPDVRDQWTTDDSRMATSARRSEATDPRRSLRTTVPFSMRMEVPTVTRPAQAPSTARWWMNSICCFPLSVRH